ncbi:MAG: glycosyltransferase family 39 protein [Candidatus Binatia bacterium]|nr:glycosyltransferase family 39 protein [Candidatus Binatia bacterium]
MQEFPWKLGTTVALAVVLVGALATLLWRVDPYFHVRVDGAIYLLTAKSLLNGDGYTYLDYTFALRPPGFPLLLAPILAVFGTNFAALNLWVSFFAVAAVGLLFVHGTQRVGPLVAAAATVLVWLNPTFTKTSFEILSDVPSVTLMMLSLVVETWAMRRPSTRRDVIVGLCVAAAAYVRTTNVLLAPAFILARALHLPANERRTPRVWAGLLVPSVVVLLALSPWLLRNQVVQPPAPAEHTIAYSYSTAMWNLDRADPTSPRYSAAEIFTRIPGQLTQAANSISLGLSGQKGWLPAALGLAALAIIFLRRREGAEIFALGTIVLLSVFFLYLPRFAIPLLFLGTVAAAEVLLWGLSRVLPGPVAQVVCATALVAVALGQPATPIDGDGVVERHQSYVRAAESIAEFCEDTETVGALQGAPLSVYLDRPVYSLRFVHARGGLPAIREFLERHDIQCVFFEPLAPAHRRLRPFFQRRFEETKQVGPYRLFRGRRATAAAAPTRAPDPAAPPARGSAS